MLEGVRTTNSNSMYNAPLRSKYLHVILLVLYSCEPWSLAKGVENRVRVFENKVPKIVFIPKRGLTGEWEKSHIYELHVQSQVCL
jgi:hypothetical protein